MVLQNLVPQRSTFHPPPPGGSTNRLLLAPLLVVFANQGTARWWRAGDSKFGIFHPSFLVVWVGCIPLLKATAPVQWYLWMSGALVPSPSPFGPSRGNGLLHSIHFPGPCCTFRCRPTIKCCSNYPRLIVRSRSCQEPWQIEPIFAASIPFVLPFKSKLTWTPVLAS